MTNDHEMGGLAPGLMITPSMSLVRELGRGGMGSVWIADHRGLKTQVVVKFIAREHALSTDALERFEREAALAAQARSPHVVQVFDHGVASNGLPYIAMELLEGEDLGTRLARERVIPPGLFGDWLTQACRGLGRAHAKGIVHRDIKPENIFLCDNDGETLVKILDFGIARADTAQGFAATRTGAMMGTAYYMSPEQTMGLKTVDHRTDLWALAVVAYFALTGVRPFDADAIGALVHAITTAPITPPSAHNPALPSSVDAWMGRALARDPQERFASAKTMAEAFVHALAGRPFVTSETQRPSLTDVPSARTSRMSSTPPLPAGVAQAGSMTPGPLGSSMLAATRTAPGAPSATSRHMQVLALAAGLTVLAGLLAVSLLLTFRARRGATAEPRSNIAAASAPASTGAEAPAAVPETAPPPSAPTPSAAPTVTTARPPPPAAPGEGRPLVVAKPTSPPESKPLEKPAGKPSAVPPPQRPAESANPLKMGLE